MKKKMKIVLVVIIAVLLIFASIIISFNKFSVLNPFSACFGVVRILVTDTKYTVIQHKPYKVIVSKPTHNEKYAKQMLDEYMAEQGFTLTEQMGSISTYSNGTEIQKVHFSVNGYYSVWEWI